MAIDLTPIKVGLFLVLLTLIFGIGMGIFFGVAEESVKAYIASGVDAYPALHDSKSADKIWRYAQRAHFHATGIAAFSIGLILLVVLSTLKESCKKWGTILIGLGGLYPLSWFSMFMLSPAIGRSAAHHHWLTESFTYIGVGGLTLGLSMLCANLFFDALED